MKSKSASWLKDVSTITGISTDELLHLGKLADERKRLGLPPVVCYTEANHRWPTAKAGLAAARISKN